MAELKQILGVTCGILCCIGIILAVALPIASLEGLQPTEIGLDYDTTTISLNEDKLFTNGRHFIGVAHDFIVYKTELQPLQFNDVRSRSNDGLSIDLDLSFQYRLLPNLEELLTLNYLFPWASYENGFYRISRNVIRDAVSKFTAFDFVYNRTAVESTIKQDLKDSLKRYNAVVENFQLLDINYPVDFSDAISDTQNANLTIQSAIFNQTKIRNAAEGQILKFKKDAQVIINEANATANTLKEQGLGKSLAFQARLDAQIEALKNVQSTLKLQDPESIISYQWISTFEGVYDNSIDGLTIDYPMPENLKKK